MRWKLLIAVTALATAVSTAASLGLAHGLLGGAARLRHPDAVAFAVFLVPLAAITYASVFVYRHTARLRPLQAALTALLSATLTLAAIILGSLLLAPSVPEEIAPAPTTRSAK
jgi:hypothetical protein